MKLPPALPLRDEKHINNLRRERDRKRERGKREKKERELRVL